MKILLLSGPNINLIGSREKGIYGTESYDDMVRKITDLLSKEKIRCTFFQSNHEGTIIDKIQASPGDADGIVINPGAYTHTSVAIRDAILSTELPVVEVHMSNVYSRENFRKTSLIEDVVIGKICGFGWHSYVLGALALKNILEGK